MRRSERDEAFTEYVVARRAHLRRTAYLICGDWHAAEDLVQTALTRLYTAWPRVIRRDAVEAYARRIIVRAHVDEGRRPWRRETPGVDGFDQASEERVEYGERDALVRALARLPLQQRRAVVLRFRVEGIEMSDRDDIDMRAWTRHAFDAEPSDGRVDDTMQADLIRAHAGLTRRRRWTGGFSALAVAGVAFVIAIGPSLLPSGDTDSGPAGFAGQTESPPPDRPKPDRSMPDRPMPDHASPRPDRPKVTSDAPARQGDGFPYFEQRHLLFTVATDHLDPSGEHLSMASNVQGGGSHGSQSVGTKLNWKVSGESGLGMVEVGIATPGMTDADRRFEIGRGGSCERHGLGDGTSAWVRRSSDGVIGAAYEQSDGGSVWVLVDPLFGNNSLTPVSSVDVSVDDLLGYVSDDRLRWLDSSPAQPLSESVLSSRIRWLASLPGEPMTQPPGWVPEPHW